MSERESDPDTDADPDHERQTDDAAPGTDTDTDARPEPEGETDPGEESTDSDRASETEGDGESATAPADPGESGGDATTGASVGTAEDPVGPETETLLDVADLDAGYGDLQILSGVDLAVGDAEYVTVVGPNGAGKSTVMKSVFGLTNVMGGRITFDGDEITGSAPEEIIHHGVGYVPQNENVFAGLSVMENLEMGAYILDEVPQDRLRQVFDRFPILEERRDQRAGTLSGGQQQMLAMGRALMLDPDLLLLDEPSAGLAPDLVTDMFDRIDGINEAGTAVLMVEQNAKEALRRCDRGYVLVQGENRFVDRGTALLNDETVRQQFLGG